MASLVVFDSSGGKSLLAETPNDVLVFHSRVGAADEVAVEVMPKDLLLVEPTRTTLSVVAEGDSGDLLVLTSGGPPGPPGPEGPEGPQGAPGMDGPGAYYQAFGFATPVAIWTLVHNQETLALNVELVDLNGESMEGYVRYLDQNTIEVEWYYPTAGEARVFR